MKPPPEERHGIEWLRGIVRRLLAPDGCPWDRKQSLESLRRYLLEETYEVLDALDEGDRAHHAEELGDLLFQIVFQAELGGHTLESIIEGIGRKLIRRHPHVFGDQRVETAEEVRVNWEQIKREERGGAGSLLAGVPRAMPALPRAQGLSSRAAAVGFDWPDAAAVRDKVLEEIAELDEAVAAQDPAGVDHELGDLLFALVNWARKLRVDPEEALRRANWRFVARFSHVEEALARRGRTPAESSLVEMEALWQEAKVVLRAQRRRAGLAPPAAHAGPLARPGAASERDRSGARPPARRSGRRRPAPRRGRRAPARPPGAARPAGGRRRRRTPRRRRGA